MGRRREIGEKKEGGKGETGGKRWSRNREGLRRSGKGNKGEERGNGEVEEQGTKKWSLKEAT